MQRLSSRTKDCHLKRKIIISNKRLSSRTYVRDLINPYIESLLLYLLVEMTTICNLLSNYLNKKDSYYLENHFFSSLLISVLASNNLFFTVERGISSVFAISS